MARKRKPKPESTGQTEPPASEPPSLSGRRLAVARMGQGRVETSAHQRPSALLDTRVIHRGDPTEPRPSGSGPCLRLDPRASTQAYINFMPPRCVELTRILKKTGSLYYHRDASGF